jgi:DNA-binding transcriptional ArsR family regulator
MTSMATNDLARKVVSVIDTENVKIDMGTLKKSVLVLRAINHNLRQQIIKLLDQEKKMTVTEIYVKLRLEQSVASQHLALLRRSGIVVTEREGKYIYYTIDKSRLAEIAKLLEDLVN